MLGAALNAYILFAAIGAVSGLVVLAAFARGSAESLALNGYLALVAMCAVYIGASLTTGHFMDFLMETLIGTAFVVSARLAMNRWLPAIGILILCHGLYDALIGTHSGVAGWYPPFCAGFDMAAGAGLVLVLRRKLKREFPAVLTK